MDKFSPKYDFALTNRYEWNCRVLDAKRLLELDSKQLKDNIEEGSRLIAEITKAPCNLLYIYPVNDASYYQVLENIGCIKVEKYLASDAQVIDFDLSKLRHLKTRNISMKEIWERYNNADHSQPLFEQVCEKKKKGILSTLYDRSNSLLFSSSKRLGRDDNCPAHGFVAWQ